MSYQQVSWTAKQGTRKKLKKQKRKHNRTASKKICFYHKAGSENKAEAINSNHSKYIW